MLCEHQIKVILYNEDSLLKIINDYWKIKNEFSQLKELSVEKRGRPSLSRKNMMK